MKLILFFIVIFTTGLFGLKAAASENKIDFLGLPDASWQVQNGEKIFDANEKIFALKGVNPLMIAKIEPISASLFRFLNLSLASPQELTGLVFWAGADKRVRYSTFWIEDSSGPKDYKLDMWQQRGFKGEILWLGIGFENGAGKEAALKIHKMFLEAESSHSGFVNSVRRFLVPEQITFYSMNVRFGPMLWAKPLNFWIFIIFTVFSILLGIFVYDRVISKRKAAGLFFLTVAALWIFYDARDVANLFGVFRNDLERLVFVQPYAKSYDDIQDFYGFLNFVQDNVSKDSSVSFVAVADLPYNLRAEYFLRPRKTHLGIAQMSPSDAFLLSYRYPAAINEQEKTIILRDRVISYQEILRFKEHSFIAKLK